MPPLRSIRLGYYGDPVDPRHLSHSNQSRRREFGGCQIYDMKCFRGFRHASGMQSEAAPRKYNIASTPNIASFLRFRRGREAI